ncbi:MAG: hypothetical protein QM831_32800 [Kofleriaceae bacterium]
MSESVVFEGTFGNGGPGVSTMPIALQGRGSVEVRDDSFVVIGWEYYVSPFRVVVLGVTMFVVLFGVGALAEPGILGTHFGSIGLGVIIAFAGGGIAYALIAMRSKLRYITFTVPWRAVKKVFKTKDGELIVTIKGIRPDGTLHFSPDGGADKLEAVLGGRVDDWRRVDKDGALPRAVARIRGPED